MYSRKELKLFIKNKLIGKQKSIPYNRQTYRWFEIRSLTDYYDSILRCTDYLPKNTKFNERCYQIMNDLFEVQKCVCGKPVNYFAFTKGYRSYCSNVCQIKGRKQIDVFIENYGMAEGKKRYEIMIKKKTQSEKRFIELYGEKEGKKKWKRRNLKCKNNTSLIGFVERYGLQNGKEKYIEFKNKLKKSHSLEGYIERYGEKKGIKKYNETIRKKAQTLDRFIEIYGEEDGTIKFSSYMNKRSKNSIPNVSKESLDFFDPILDYILEIAQNEYVLTHTYIGKKNNKEYFLIDKDKNRTYFYDLTIEPLKLIIEYNGSAFHPNKKNLNEKEWNEWKNPLTLETADIKYKFDQRKIQIAENNGFHVIEIWDTDDKQEASIMCKKEIKKRMKKYEKYMSKCTRGAKQHSTTTTEEYSGIYEDVHQRNSLMNLI